MKILSKMLGRASDLADVEPLIALFLGAALLAVFLTALSQTKPASEPGGGSGLLWTLTGTARGCSGPSCSLGC